jgi:hypothetical protein
MNPNQRFAPGDRVRHAGRPEWGEGQVLEAEATGQADRPAQRLIVRFSGQGRVRLNTAFAELIPADQATQDAATMPPTIEPLTGKPRPVDLSQLPDELTDPLSSAVRRFRLSLNWYRFEMTARGMIEWAVARSGLSDPLGGFERRELESAFAGFYRRLDAHLRQVAGQAAREQADEARRIVGELRPGVREAITRVLKGQSTVPRDWRE